MPTLPFPNCDSSNRIWETGLVTCLNRTSRIATLGDVCRMTGDRICSGWMDSLPAFQMRTCSAVTSVDTLRPMYRTSKSELFPDFTIVDVVGLMVSDRSRLFNGTSPSNIVAVTETIERTKLARPKTGFFENQSSARFLDASGLSVRGFGGSGGSGSPVASAITLGSDFDG